MDAIGNNKMSNNYHLENRTDNVFKNSTIGIIMQVIQIITSLVCRLVFARLLEENYLGVDSFFSSIISFLNIAELGIGSAILFEFYSALSKKDEDETIQLLNFYKKTYFIIGLIILLMGLFLLPFIGILIPNYSLSEDINLVYMLYVLSVSFSYFFSYKSTLLIATQQNYICSIVHTIVIISQNIIEIIILVLTKNFILYLFIQLSFSNVLYYFILSKIVDIKFKNLFNKNNSIISKEKKKKLFKNVKYIFINQVSSKLYNNSTNIVITIFGGLSIMGKLSNYSLIIATIVTITVKITEAIKPSLGNFNVIVKSNNKIDIFKEIQFMYFWMFMFLSNIYIFTIHDIVLFLFGDRYVLDFSVVVLLGINFYLVQQFSFIPIFKETMGLFNYGKWAYFVSGIINIVISCLLIKPYGINGVLLSSSLSFLFAKYYLSYLVVKKGLNMSFIDYIKKDFQYMIEAIIVFIILHFITSLFSFPLLLDLFFNTIVCIIIINVFIFLIHKNDINFKSLIGRIKKMFNTRKGSSRI